MEIVPIHGKLNCSQQMDDEYPNVLNTLNQW